MEAALLARGAHRRQHQGATPTATALPRASGWIFCAVRARERLAQLLVAGAVAPCNARETVTGAQRWFARGSQRLRARGSANRATTSRPAVHRIGPATGSKKLYSDRSAAGELLVKTQVAEAMQRHNREPCTGASPA